MLGYLESLWISVTERHGHPCHKGRDETNGYWPVTGAACPVWLARATAQTLGQSLAGMASDRSPGSPLAAGEERDDAAG